jgi:hypothetical protein
MSSPIIKSKQHGKLLKWKQVHTLTKVSNDINNPKPIANSFNSYFLMTRKRSNMTCIIMHLHYVQTSTQFQLGSFS